jgi:RNA polymerase sigma factor (sigma-70 family)
MTNISMETDPDWRKIIFDPDWMKRLDALAARRFKPVVVAEEATTFVIEKLSNNHWQRLHGFSGKAKPSTYAYSAAVNLLEDYSRKRFGRPRPEAWLQREGGIWLKIWTMHCLERQSKDKIIHTLCNQEKRETDFVAAIIRTIKSRIPNCGAKNTTVSISHTDALADEDDHSVIIPSQITLEASINRAELEERLSLFTELLENLHRPSNELPADNPAPMSSAVMKQLQRLRENLDLTEEEIIVMRMAFQEGLKLKMIAQVLGMPAYQPGRILKRVFKLIITALDDADIPAQDLQLLLAEVE